MFVYEVFDKLYDFSHFTGGVETLVKLYWESWFYAFLFEEFTYLILE